MILSDEQLSIILLSRSLALSEVESGRMDRLNNIVREVYRSGINILLLFMNEEEFKRAINDQE